MQKIIKQTKDVNPALLLDLLSIEYPEINSFSLSKIVTLFKERFNEDITERELYMLTEPSLEEEILDLQLIYNNF